LWFKATDTGDAGEHVGETVDYQKRAWSSRAASAPVTGASAFPIVASEETAWPVNATGYGASSHW
ncbi:MAG TPA: hypothetical protein VFE11_00740, partial [Dongiaceae bacterium]|nr:hypothetical protein [Dongiaceae bacterium]